MGNSIRIKHYLTTYHNIDTIQGNKSSYNWQLLKENKITFSILLKLALLYSFTFFHLESKGQGFSCGVGIQPASNVAEKPDPNTDCGKQSAIFNSYFRRNMYFIPQGTIVNKTTVPKKIKVRFMIANPQTATKKNFDQSDIPALQTLITWLNNTMQDVAAPNKPQTNICGTCHIPNTRIQYELQGITFYNSRVFNCPQDYNTDVSNDVIEEDSVLNIFFCYFENPCPWGGHANPQSYIERYNFFSNPRTDYIVIGNAYQHYINNDWWSQLVLLDHELTHLFGHHHLDSEIPPYTSCNEADIDYLTDIFNTGTSKSCPLTGTFGDCDPANPNYTNVSCNNNVMSLRGYTWVSPIQLGIMHRELFMGRMHRYAYPTEAPTTHPWIVRADQTWDFPIRMFQDIRINRDKTLIIKCEVQMPKDGRIVIEKGGKLIIDGGHIRAYTTESTWKGIEVKGAKSLPSTEINQGCLEMKNGAIVENAIEGVWNFSFENLNTDGGGGIIKAVNSSFYNCFRAVGLSSYDIYNYGGNNCSFKEVDFTIDEKTPFMERYQNNQGNAFMTSFNIKSFVNVYNCTFKNEIPYNILSSGKRAGAIGVMATAIRVGGSKFDGFSYGILSQAYAALPTRNARIYSNTFNHITKNVTMAAQAYGDIRGNQVTNMINSELSNIVGNHTVSTTIPGYAFYLDYTANSYVGCRNYVNGTTDMPNLEWLKRTGIVAKNTYIGGATVINNTFENLGKGFQTQGHNPRINNFCNLYNHNDLAWSINPQSSAITQIMNNQGNGCSANNIRAGNQFVGNGRDIASYIHPNNTWKYYAFTTPSNTIQYPFYHSGTVNVISCNSTSSADVNSQCGKDWKYCLKSSTIEQVRGYRTEYIGLGTEERRSPDGEMLKISIVEGYNDLEDIVGLQSFLEEADDDESRKQLMPLYLETNQYDKVASAIDGLLLSEIEKDAYTNYYSFLWNATQEQRSVESLTPGELSYLQDLAENDLEVSVYARSILDWTGMRLWVHDIEEEPMGIMAGNINKSMLKTELSKLKGATPNPTKNSTVINVFVADNDAGKTPELVIRNWTGRLIESVKLMKGNTYVNVDMDKYSSGIYFYGLYINGALVETKKLSVIK